MLIIGAFLHVFSQDMHFSQFYNTPLNTNSAFTSNPDNDWRLSNVYRRQWDAIGYPYVTASIAFDKQIYVNNDRLSIGFLYMNDATGINTNTYYGSIGYWKRFNRNAFAIGLQGGYVSKYYSLLTFNDQYDRITGTYDGTSKDQTNGDSYGYFDLIAGFSWTFYGDKFKPTIGYSIFHLNEPKLSFISSGTGNNLAMRHLIIAGGIWKATQSLLVIPNFLYMIQNSASDMVVGSNFGWRLQNYTDLTYLYFGLSARAGIKRTYDAMIFCVGFASPRWDLGVSYDANVSTLSSAANNFNGAFEITLILKGNRPLDKVTIPCDRY